MGEEGQVRVAVEPIAVEVEIEVAVAVKIAGEGGACEATV